MPMKGTGPGDPRVVGRFEGGLTWMTYPDERMQRASHAVCPNDEVWVIDPVDAPGLDDIFDDLGPVAGVVVLLDRHKRDAAAIARRHGVSVFVPATMEGAAEALDAPTTRFDSELGDTGYRTRTVLDNRLWQETALYHTPSDTLVVPEALGTAPYFLAGDERLGVHPMLRAMPPRRSLAGFSPDRVLVAHGSPVLEDGSMALHEALTGSRRRLPRLYAKNVRSLLPV